MVKIEVFAAHDPREITEADLDEDRMEAVSELVQPVGPAGLNGVVTKDGVPQAGLIVELENGNKSVITDTEGIFDFGNN